MFYLGKESLHYFLVVWAVFLADQIYKFVELFFLENFIVKNKVDDFFFKALHVCGWLGFEDWDFLLKFVEVYLKDFLWNVIFALWLRRPWLIGWFFETLRLWFFNLFLFNVLFAGCNFDFLFLWLMTGFLSCLRFFLFRIWLNFFLLLWQRLIFDFLLLLFFVLDDLLYFLVILF